jgi:hypothetical protein
VRGRILCKGAPAAGATVFFKRRGADPMNEHTIMGIAGPDGSFELVTGSLGSGAPPGDYDVFIQWREIAGQAKGRPQHGTDKLKGRYAKPQHPILFATLEAKPNRLPVFEVDD